MLRKQGASFRICRLSLTRIFSLQESECLKVWARAGLVIATARRVLRLLLFLSFLQFTLVFPWFNWHWEKRDTYLKMPDIVCSHTVHKIVTPRNEFNFNERWSSDPSIFSYLHQTAQFSQSASPNDMSKILRWANYNAMNGGNKSKWPAEDTKYLFLSFYILVFHLRLLKLRLAVIRIHGTNWSNQVYLRRTQSRGSVTRGASQSEICINHGSIISPSKDPKFVCTQD